MMECEEGALIPSQTSKSEESAQSFHCQGNVQSCVSCRSLKISSTCLGALGEQHPTCMAPACENPTELARMRCKIKGKRTKREQLIGGSDWAWLGPSIFWHSSPSLNPVPQHISNVYLYCTWHQGDLSRVKKYKVNVFPGKCNTIPNLRPRDCLKLMEIKKAAAAFSHVIGKRGRERTDVPGISPPILSTLSFV